MYLYIILLVLLSFTIINGYVIILIIDKPLILGIFLLYLLITYSCIIYNSIKQLNTNNNTTNTNNISITITIIYDYCYVINPGENDICLGIKL